MYSYTLISPAKINLHLEILGNLANGDRHDAYHQLVMIMQSIDLADIITIRSNGTEKTRIYCHNNQVPLDQTNLAFKAANLMAKKFPLYANNFGGIDITIDKKIPIAAGLAGGSSNAAAVLVGINLMWELGLTQAELRELGALIGSDVPFCIAGGTAIATGRGEKIEPLPDLDNLWVILAKHSNISISTAWAYSTYREKYQANYINNLSEINSRTHQIHSGDLVQAIVKKDGEKIGKLLYNDLEKIVLPEFKEIDELINSFKNQNPLGVMMSGSGSTVFALCHSKIEAEEITQKVKNSLANPNVDFWIAKMCNHGIITHN